MSTLLLKTGDEVIVTTGKYRGKKGKVTQVFPKMNRVVVEGMNLFKRHLKTRRKGETKGQIVEFAMPMHASNVQLVGTDGKPARHNKRPQA